MLITVLYKQKVPPNYVKKGKTHISMIMSNHNEYNNFCYTKSYHCDQGLIFNFLVNYPLSSQLCNVNIYSTFMFFPIWKTWTAIYRNDLKELSLINGIGLDWTGWKCNNYLANLS